MIEDKIFFVSGLPRSGSTLMMNLLGQNPNHHVTPTNGLLDLVMNIKSSWVNDISFRSQGIENVQPFVTDSMEGLVRGYHKRHLEDGKIVFDKSRGWVAYIELMEEVFQKEVRVIVTVRDVRAIIASFEKIHRKNSMIRLPTNQETYIAAQTIEGRARSLLAPASVVGISLNRTRDAMQRGVANRLIIVPYTYFTHYPKETMNQIHSHLGLDPFDYDPDNVEQITHEDDSVHGMDLHKIKTKIEPATQPAWEGILPTNLCSLIDREHGDINRLAASPNLIIPMSPTVFL
jgi:sulfotransferase